MGEPEMKQNDKEDKDWSVTAQAWLVGVGIGALILAAMVVSYEIGTNKPSDQTATKPAGTTSAPPPAPVAGPGRELFVGSCGSCHTLASAGTSGTVGPDLDALMPTKAMVESAIKVGGTGSGTMPPGLFEGKEATEVADYVSASAGAGG